MSKKLLLATLLLAGIAPLLSSCDTLPPYNPNDPIGHEPAKAVTVVVYRGHDLFCLEQARSKGIRDYTCDFAEFYHQPPVTNSNLPVARVALTTMPYRGKTLYCFKYISDADHEAFTCDFDRFLAENNGAELPPQG